MKELEISGVRKRYGKKEVLRGVSLSCGKGSAVGILGSNGSGKSTLLSLLAGIQKPDTGVFRWEGKDLFSDSALLRETVGYVPQGTPLFEELSALDNLRLWFGKAELKKELESGILRTLGVEEFLRTRVSRLSGGMKKRLSIGCAMSRHPRILLLDEPSTALDMACKAQIRAYFDAYRKAGGTVLLVTHDPEEIALCDRVYLLENGVLEQTEPGPATARLEGGAS